MRSRTSDVIPDSEEDDSAEEEEGIGMMSATQQEAAAIYEGSERSRDNGDGRPPYAGHQLQPGDWDEIVYKACISRPLVLIALTSNLSPYTLTPCPLLVSVIRQAPLRR